MSKRLNTLLLALTGLVVIAGMGLYVFRHSLLETLIHDQLRKQGIPVQSISVLDVSLNTLLLHNLMVGTGKELRVNSIRVTWDLMDLLAGKSVSVEISGLQVALDLSGERLPLGSLQSMISSTGEDSGTLLWLPAFSLRDSTIHLHSALGDLSIALSGDVDQSQSGIQTIRLSAGISGQTKGILVATLDAQGNMQGKITVSEGMLNLPEAKISNFTGEATFSLAAMRPQHIHAEFMLSGMHLPGKDWVGTVSEQTGKSVPPFTLRDMTVDQITFKGDIHGSPDSWTGKFDLGVAGGQLTAGTLNIQRAFVSLPMQVNFNQGTWRLGLRNPGRIELGKIDSIETLSFPNPLGFSIPQADFEWVKNLQGLVLKHEVLVTPTNFTLLAEQEKSPPIKAQIQSGKIALSGTLGTDEKYQGQVVIKDATFFLPQSHLQLKHISATLHLGVTETDKIADFAIGQLQHQVPGPFFDALSISGSIKNKSVDGKPMVYSLNAVGGVPGSRYLKFTGNHIPDSGNGMLKVEIAPLSFSPDNLQPGALSPVLAQLEDVSGLVSANAHLRWSKQGVSSSRGVVDLQNVSFAHEATKISGLNATLNLSNLLPLSSLPQQIITIQRIDFGVPLEDLLVSYQIEGADPPRIILEKAHFSMMDGLLSLEPTVINPAFARSDIMIRVNNIDLATFFDLIQIEGLTGNGYLDGNIPVTLEGNQVIIRNGQFATKVPGVLRFKSDKASQLLAETGEEMNLLLQAVQDFHYTELSLKLDKSVTHGLIVSLSLLGNNPNVKEGRIFRLNINFESNIDKLLESINQGYSLSNEILRDSFKLR